MRNQGGHSLALKRDKRTHHRCRRDSGPPGRQLRELPDTRAPQTCDHPASAFSRLSCSTGKRGTRIAGTNMNFHFLEEMALPVSSTAPQHGRDPPALRRKARPPRSRQSPGLVSQRGMSALAALGRAPLTRALPDHTGASPNSNGALSRSPSYPENAVPPQRRCRCTGGRLAYGLDRDDFGGDT